MDEREKVEVCASAKFYFANMQIANLQQLNSQFENCLASVDRRHGDRKAVLCKMDTTKRSFGDTKILRLRSAHRIVSTDAQHLFFI